MLIHSYPPRKIPVLGREWKNLEKGIMERIKATYEKTINIIRTNNEVLNKKKDCNKDVCSVLGATTKKVQKKLKPIHIGTWKMVKVEMKELLFANVMVLV